MFNRDTFHIIQGAKTAIFIDQKLRDDKDRNTLHTCGRIGGSGQYKVNDIFGHIMFAVSDKNLLPTDKIMITFGDGLRPDRSQIGPRLAFRQQ